VSFGARVLVSLFLVMSVYIPRLASFIHSFIHSRLHLPPCAPLCPLDDDNDTLPTRKCERISLLGAR
jgi:hypothetical protein